MLNVSINSKRKVSSNNFRIILTVRKENLVGLKAIGGRYKTIDEAVEYLSGEGLKYTLFLNEENHSAIKIVRCR